MKIPSAIAEFVTEFSGFQRTPDFKAVRSCRCLSDCNGCSRPISGAATPVRKDSFDRRHSTLITVGADQLPTVSITPPNGPRSGSITPDHHRYIKHCPYSAPVLSSLASSTSLKEKLQKIKRENSSGSESDFKSQEENVNSKKSSVSSYRVI